MNRRTAYACGQSGKLVQPHDRYVTWSGVDLQEAARRSLSAPARKPEARELQPASDGREGEVQR